MKVQACTKCGAQFDVSSFETGQSFTCGACGTVLQAGIAAPAVMSAAAAGESARSSSAEEPSRGRKPGTARSSAAAAPASASRSPTARPTEIRRGESPGAGGRQYVPAARSGAAAAASPSTSRRAAPGGKGARGAGDGASGGADGGRRGRGGRKGGPSPVLLGSVLGVVVVAVVALLILGGGDEAGGGSQAGGSQSAGRAADASGAGPTAGGGTPTASSGGSKPPAVPSRSAEAIMGDYGVSPPTTARAWRDVITELKGLPDDDKRRNSLTRVYSDYVRTVDGSGDADARRHLGHNEFKLTAEQKDVLEGITEQSLEYVRGVRAAEHKRWFTTEEQREWESSQKSLAELLAHFDRLENDPEFAAGTALRGNFSTNAKFKDLNYVGHWASPWLICYSSSERLSEFELLGIEDLEERKLRRNELEAKQRRYMRLVEEKGILVKQLYARFMQEFGGPLSIKPLMDPWGGRPDYPGNVRSFRNGCPMAMWIFDNKASWDQYHKDEKELIPHFAAGYFSGQTEMVMLYDEDSAERVFEIAKTLHEGTHQLEFFYSRQKRNWGKPPFSQDFLGEGLAEWFAAVKCDADRKLEFVGINVPRLTEAKRTQEMLKSSGKDYKMFPLENLTQFNRYHQASEFAAQTWELGGDLGMSMLYQQGWAFVHFCKTYRDGRYWPNLTRFLDNMMQRLKEDEQVQPAFKEAFEIRGEEDWEDLDEAFGEFMKELLAMDLRPFTYLPPPREMK